MQVESFFLTKWPFSRPKFLCAPGSKFFLSYYSYHKRFIKQSFYYCECKQYNSVQPCLSDTAKIKTKNKKEMNNSTKKEESKQIYDQTVSVDLEEVKCFVAQSQNFDVDKYLKYMRIISNKLSLIRRLLLGILLHLSF